MKNHMLKQCGVAALAAGLAFTVGCASVAKVSSQVGVAAGVITPQQGESLTSAFKGFTPENEHYLGRAVGATILQKFSVYENEAANHYVRLIGQACAQASDMPVTFGGYTFQILDSEEVNAFAAPGGFIFVTRGMLRLCQNEDDLAAVLAHEVAHVQLKHGVNAISRGRTLEAGRILVSVGLNQFGSANVVNSLEQLNKLTEVFGGSVGDIVTSLMLKGYSREQEYEADQVAVTIMERLGYDPSALTRVLDRMGEKVHKGGPGFGSTHPPPADRVKAAGKRITAKQAAENAIRAKRYAKAMQGV